MPRNESSQRPLARLGLWAGALGLALLSIPWWMRTSHVPDAETQAVLSELRGWVPAQSVEVPSRPGFSVTEGAGSSLWLFRHRAELAGQGWSADLCQQRAQSQASPLALIPLRLGYTAQEMLADSDQTNAWRQAGLFTPDTAAQMPALRIVGQAAGLEGGSPLQIEFDPTPGRASAALTFSDEQRVPVEGRPPGAIAFRREAWVLYRPVEGVTGLWTMALHLERTPLAGCEAGQLQGTVWQRATTADLGASDVKTQVLAPAGSRWVTLEAGGHYTVPEAPTAHREDADLFQQAQAQGLIEAEAGSKVLRVAPRDAPVAAQAPGLVARSVTVQDMPWDEGHKRTHQRLFTWADGAEVRSVVARYNESRLWAALRVREPQSGAQGRTDDELASWRADIDGLPVTVSEDMPAAHVRLLNELPQGWSSWRRALIGPALAQRPSSKAPVVFRWTPPPQLRGAVVQIAVLGRLGQVHGGDVLAARPACATSACPRPDALQEVQLRVAPTSEYVSIEVYPDTVLADADPDRPGQVMVTDQGDARWKAASFSKEKDGTASAMNVETLPVRVDTAFGTAVFAHGAATPEARSLGLLPILGPDLKHRTGLAAALQRRGGGAATLTIDDEVQAALQKALDCIAIRGGRLDPKGACVGAASAPSAKVTAEAVVLDARTGAIRGVAQAPGVPASVHDADLEAFDRFRPKLSPLQPQAWRHDGGGTHAAGSTFKVFDALALETQAEGDPLTRRILQGLTPRELDVLGRPLGFVSASPCYPSPCEQGAGHRITNFRDHRADAYLLDGRLGIEQALGYSLNTWFAWAMERGDAVARQPRKASAQPLETGAMDAARPVLKVLRDLDFGSPLVLDAGLLGEGFPWSPADAMAATPSTIDPPKSADDLRRMAVGLQMQVSALQMAQVAAAVAKGETIKPHVLARLDEKAAEPGVGRPLSMPLERVRAGMRLVVQRGTAASAFKGLPKDLQVFGKTGTAPYGTPDGIGNAWFMGWMEMAQGDKVAFAVRVSHTRETGGERAAPVIANLAAILHARGSRGN